MADLEVSVLDSRSGKSTGKVALDAEHFGIAPNVSVMHQVVTAQLGARRQGTHNTKTRSEVRGGKLKALATKRHRACPSRLNSFSPMARRRRGARPEAS